MKDTIEVGQYFSDKWWSDTPDVYNDLIKKIADRSYMVKCKAHQVNRAVLLCEHILASVPKGGRVLDMACGVGYITCYLAKNGYRVEAFDISEKGIERSRNLSEQLGIATAMFSLDDQHYLEKLDNESFDAILGIGFFRYLSKDEQSKVYDHVKRILKPKGKFLLTHQNQLFEVFALNDGMLRFWEDVIENYSDAGRLLEGKSVREAIEERVKVPQRKFESHSVSKWMQTEVENPLTYSVVAEQHGFKLEKLMFPASHVLPPWLEAEVDQEQLAQVKREVCLDRAEDWRAMFMEFEFLAFLEKM